MAAFFGQLIDPDVALTAMNGSNFSIEVLEKDPDLDITEIELPRSPQVIEIPIYFITSFVDENAVLWKRLLMRPVLFILD